MNTPKVSVVIVVFNGEQHIERSVGSIQKQTFTDWELVVVDDGSTDNTPLILKRLAREDERIRILTNEENKKLIYTRNRGLSESKGEYIAILDSDDVSYPDRLEKQVRFMEENPEYGLCGALYKKKFADGSESVWDFPEHDEDIRIKMVFGVANLNSAVMMRSSTLREHHLQYDPGFPVSEDYKLFFDISKVAKLHNLPIVLGEYYYHGNQQTKKRAELMQRCSAKIMYLHFEHLGIELNEVESEVLFKCYNFRFPLTQEELGLLESTFGALVKMNSIKRLFNPAKANTVIAKKFFESCYHSISQIGRAAYRLWSDSALSQFYQVPLRERVIFWFRQFRSN